MKDVPRSESCRDTLNPLSPANEVHLTISELKPIAISFSCTLINEKLMSSLITGKTGFSLLLGTNFSQLFPGVLYPRLIPFYTLLGVL